jgi:hypothetical protein
LDEDIFRLNEVIMVFIREWVLILTILKLGDILVSNKNSQPPNKRGINLDEEEFNQYRGHFG